MQRKNTWVLAVGVQSQGCCHSQTKSCFHRGLDWAEAEPRAGRDGSSTSWFQAAVEILLLLCPMANLNSGSSCYQTALFMSSSGSFLKQFAWTLSLLLRYEIHPRLQTVHFQTVIHRQVILLVLVPTVLRIINNFLSLLMVYTFSVCMYAHLHNVIYVYTYVYACMYL